MPVTVRPQPGKVGLVDYGLVESPEELFKVAAKTWTTDGKNTRGETNKPVGTEDRPILKTSFIEMKDSVAPYGNGFVTGVMRSFQQDLHLVLRPEDVWLAILMQFNFYVNGNAKQLRKLFVAHDGKKELVVSYMIPFADVDIGDFAQKMTKLVQENMVEPGVDTWLLPSFTTTTNHDVTVAAIVMMSTFKAYFEYVMMCGCGFPSVTLEGDKKDWEDIRERVKRFAKYGAEPTEWVKYLGKVLDYMVRSFETPDAQEVKDFWMRVCHENGAEGSGRGFCSLSGWITPFCFWDEKGKKIQHVKGTGSESPRSLILEGIRFPVIKLADVPKCCMAQVPVKVIDFCETFHTTLIAGCVGMAMSAGTHAVEANNARREGKESRAARRETGEEVSSEAGENVVEFDTARPISGWWMLKDKEKEKEEGNEEEKGKENEKHIDWHRWYRNLHWW